MILVPAAAKVVGGAIRTFDKHWSAIDVVHKTLDAVEDVTSVREADQGLGSASAVEFDPTLKLCARWKIERLSLI